VHKGDVLFEIDARALNAVLTKPWRRWLRPRRNSQKRARPSNATRRLPRSRRLRKSASMLRFRPPRAAAANVHRSRRVETARLNVEFTKVTC